MDVGRAYRDAEGPVGRVGPDGLARARGSGNRLRLLRVVVRLYTGTSFIIRSSGMKLYLERTVK
jgi:hypothetical protein